MYKPSIVFFFTLVDLGEMERVLALRGGNAKLLAQHVDARVIGQLEVVDARHHRRQDVVRILGRVQRRADHRQRRR